MVIQTYLDLLISTIRSPLNDLNFMSSLIGVGSGDLILIRLILCLALRLILVKKLKKNYFEFPMLV